MCQFNRLRFLSDLHRAQEPKLTARIHQPGSSSCKTILDFSESMASMGSPSEKDLGVQVSQKLRL